jgi:hypothetical protein
MEKEALLMGLPLMLGSADGNATSGRVGLRRERLSVSGRVSSEGMGSGVEADAMWAGLAVMTCGEVSSSSSATSLKLAEETMESLSGRLLTVGEPLLGWKELTWGERRASRGGGTVTWKPDFVRLMIGVAWMENGDRVLGRISFERG